MEDTTMIKKDYMKPEMQTVELKHKCQILAGSVDANGMNNGLIEEEVTEGWAPEFNDVLNNEIFGIK
jgi:hypothetical protein